MCFERHGEREGLALTRLDVDQALISIAATAMTDPEAATSRERRLLRDVLLALANGGSRELARGALRSFDLQFRRIS